MKFGKRQTIIFTLMGIVITIYYYANKLLQTGQTLSDGFLIGFLMGLVFVGSCSILFLWGQMLFSNFKVRWKSKIE